MYRALLIIGLSITLLSCAQNKRSMLCKHWRVVQMTMNGDLVPMEMTKNIHFNFDKDGVYTLNAGTRAEKGTWSFNIEKMELTTREKAAKPITVSITTLNDSMLAFTRNDKAGEVTFVLKTYQ